METTYQIPEGKQYFRTYEVIELFGVHPQLLRTWEQQFASLRPQKSPRGHRVYRRKDVELLAQIHHLTQVQSLSISETKAQLRAWKQNVMDSPSLITAPELAQQPNLRQGLEELVHFVRNFRI